VRCSREARPSGCADGFTDEGNAMSWTAETIGVEHDQGMPARIYGQGPCARPAPLVLHLHGGAFVGGSLDTGRIVPTLLAEAGAVVVSADYPLAPAHQFPDPLQAAYRALSYLHESRENWVSKKSGVFVAGEEAGGNLAAALALMARDQQGPPLAGQILLSPMLDPCMATCSIRQAEAGPVGCQWADGWHQYLGSADKAAHPYAAPLGSSRLAGLAPALVLTAQDDPMRDESLSYARRLRESGVTVQEHVVAAPSGWPNALSFWEQSFDRLESYLRERSAAEEAWTTAVRDRFVAFFAETMPLQRSAAAFRTRRN
jgi:acetyl esterase